MQLLAYITPDVEKLLVDGATELLERQSNDAFLHLDVVHFS